MTHITCHRVPSAYVRFPHTPRRAYDLGMPAPHMEWTVEMVSALPDDGKRYEVIDGELLSSPAPSYLHQLAILLLRDLLLHYVEALGQEVLVAPAAVTFSKLREVQPDLFVLPKPNGRRATRFEDVGMLTLAVEVLSPHSLRADRQKKRDMYQDERVPEYWIVDPHSRAVERWRPESTQPEVETTRLSWQPLLSHDALQIDLPAYFRSVHDD